MLVSSLLSSLPALGNVVLFFLFLLILFGILGVQLFGGVYESRCRVWPTPRNGRWPIDPAIQRLCGEYECPKGTYCGNPADHGIELDSSELGVELNYGLTRFDDIIEATFSIFQAMTLEGWST
jgi:hypothetical protein